MTAWLKRRVGDYPLPAGREALNALVREHAEGFSEQRPEQLRAWEYTLELTERLSAELLEAQPSTRGWGFLLEFAIPRRQRRPDLILLADDVVFVIELKVGAADFDAAARWQTEEYALDLRDFHEGSRGRRIVPVLVATEASEQATEPLAQLPRVGEAFVAPVQRSGAAGLARCVLGLYGLLHHPTQPAIDLDAWDAAPYRPTLNIIEAAEELFAEHSVREISHAYADNLKGTCDALVSAIQDAQRRGERVVCFVTGVPGSGKTLAGLSAVHDPVLRQEGRPPGVFLSGNGPLVKIVRAALARDAAKQGGTRKAAARQVSTFIQNVHSFIQEYAFKQSIVSPPENVVIFDEAQRAWDQDQIDRKRKTQGKELAQCSEAALVLQIMERCKDWSVVIALVGGGQEINTGEAGLAEWGRALAARPVGWRVLASPEVLPGSVERAGGRLFDLVSPGSLRVEEELRLHLEVSVRSPRAQRIAEWVDLLLAGRPDAAGDLLGAEREFPLVQTRDLDQARAWLRGRSGGDRRPGLVASSAAKRLRAYGIELSSGFRHGYPYEEWFLAGPDDTRSSFQLEVAASEFECQGLELDWVGLCWGGDLTFNPKAQAWTFRRFRGADWERVNLEAAQQFLLNRYRVLLTRARYGMVIWVPRGEGTDQTLDPKAFDATAEYLQRAGVPLLP